MATRTQIATALAKQSVEIIKANKRLLFFPLVKTILLVALILLIIPHILQFETIALKTGHLSAHQYIVFIALILGFFIGLHLIEIFSSAALTAATIQYMETKSKKLSPPLKRTVLNAHRLFAWSFVMSNLGIFIRICEGWVTDWQHYKMAKKFLSQLPWLIGSLLVVSVIVSEQKNPIRALKRSSTLIAENWGQVTRSRLRLGGPLTLIKVATFIPLLLGVYFGGKFNLYLGSSITFILFFGINIVNSATQGILMSALYLYAVDPAKTDQFFTNTLLKNALYRPKKPL